ncbi:hypothetical protein [Nocardia sp. CA-120079]|uniref:hypothetical protein n=1 Tax=Nocardia sp. CA-120079 TaxID=3239974 RepID=UPI003D99FDB2
MAQMSALVTDTRGPRMCLAGRFPDAMRDMRKIRQVPELRLIDITKLRRKLAEQVNETYEQEAVTVVAWFDQPGGVLMPMKYWHLGQRSQPVDEMLVERIGTRAGRDKLRVLRDELRRGKHTIMTVWSDDRAAFAPYEWTRRAFPEWELPEVLKEPSGDNRPAGDCVQVVYRKSQSARVLLDEFADAADPQWEVDRRLSGGPGRIPLDRRPWLRGVVYVEDGVVARVRALDPRGVWEDVSDKVSLAPVSAPLTREQVEEQLPTLRIFPGEQRLAAQGSPREYIEL